jgi:predicted dehydrogenase
MAQQHSDPIRLAIVGAGIFARDAHTPVLLALRDRFQVVAVYSRRPESAAALAEKYPYPVAVATDLPALLARDDLDAVDLTLPIPVMPEAVMTALDAGKHVISEKPVAPDVATAHALLDHSARYPRQVWMVAENYRYEPVFVRAAELVQSGAIGTPRMVTWVHHGFVTPDNKYYGTEWRQKGAFPGGYLLDGGVHNIAALRLILGEIAAVSAVSAAFRADLPPADTLNAALVFASGCTGMYSITHAVGAPWDPTLDIAGEGGTLRIGRGRIELTRGGETEVIEVPSERGIEGEFAAFADAIRGGDVHRNTPQQAAQDVAVIEAMLRSGATGQRVDVARLAW